jgi:hypothetical protein
VAVTAAKEVAVAAAKEVAVAAAEEVAEETKIPTAAAEEEMVKTTPRSLPS